MRPDLSTSDGRQYQITKDMMITILRESRLFQNITLSEKILDWSMGSFVPMGGTKPVVQPILIIQTIRKKYKTPEDVIADRLNKHAVKRGDQ